MQKNLLYVWIVASALSFAPCAIADTADQETRTNAVIIAAESPQTLKQSNAIQSNTTFEHTLIQEKLGLFEKRSDDLKWLITYSLTGMGIITAIVLGSVGFISIKNQKEYDRAINDIKEEHKNIKELRGEAKAYATEAKNHARNAENSCSEIEGMEKKSREKYASINSISQPRELVDDRDKIELTKITNKKHKWFNALNASQGGDFDLANKLWTEITQEDPQDYEAFYNWGITLSLEADRRRLTDKNVIKSICEKYEKAVNINPRYYQALHKWALVFSYCSRNVDMISDDTEAESYLNIACEKYEQATKIEPDGYNIFIDWGILHSGWAIHRGTNVEFHFNLATEKFQMAERIKPGSAAYNLASLYGERGDIDNCKKWLIEAEKEGVLPTLEQAMKNDHLHNVFRFDWFKELNWKKEQDVKLH